MSQQKKTTPIPAELITEVTAQLNEIITALAPYTKALSEQQRISLPKMSDKSVAFVQKVKDYLLTNPQFAPNFMNKAHFSTELKTATDLKPLLQLAMQLQSSLSDTTMSSGSEAYLSARQYYNSVKQASKSNIPSAKEVYENLSERFPATRKKNPLTKAA